MGSADRAAENFIMAVTSFKQQCPSCEAMVPIRDANLIGRSGPREERELMRRDVQRIGI